MSGGSSNYYASSDSTPAHLGGAFGSGRGENSKKFTGINLNARVKASKQASVGRK